MADFKGPYLGGRARGDHEVYLASMEETCNYQQNSYKLQTIKVITIRYSYMYDNKYILKLCHTAAPGPVPTLFEWLDSAAPGPVPTLFEWLDSAAPGPVPTLFEWLDSAAPGLVPTLFEWLELPWPSVTALKQPDVVFCVQRLEG